MAKGKKLSLFLEIIIINVHTANPEQSGDAKLEGPIRIASCTNLSSNFSVCFAFML